MTFGVAALSRTCVLPRFPHLPFDRREYFGVATDELALLIGNQDQNSEAMLRITESGEYPTASHPKIWMPYV